MGSQNLTFVSPSFTAKSVAQWLNENVSPGADVPHYSSATACRAIYGADNKTWTVEVNGGGWSRKPIVVTITLPSEAVNIFRRHFLFEV